MSKHGTRHVHYRAFLYRGSCRFARACNSTRCTGAALRPHSKTGSTGPGQKRNVPEPNARCLHRGAFRRCRETATAGTACQKHARECRFTGCDARSDGKYCKEHRCVHAGCGGQRLLVGKKFDDGSKYCKRHKCVHCRRKAVWQGRFKRRGYCHTHTCHTDFCGTGTMSKGARSCKRHKCAYCNSAVIGYRGGLHNRHCKKHSCLMCLNGTTSATAQVCQNHACGHPRCFGRCRRGITDDVRGRGPRRSVRKLSEQAAPGWQSALPAVPRRLFEAAGGEGSAMGGRRKATGGGGKPATPGRDAAKTRRHGTGEWVALTRQPTLA